MNAHGAICAQIDIIVAKIKHPLFDANSRRRQVFFCYGETLGDTVCQVMANCLVRGI